MLGTKRNDSATKVTRFAWFYFCLLLYNLALQTFKVIGNCTYDNIIREYKRWNEKQLITILTLILYDKVETNRVIIITNDNKF